MVDTVVQKSAAVTQESGTTTQPVTEPKRVNLDELEDFRKYKSTVDKRQNELLAQLEAEKKTREEAEKRYEGLIVDPVEREKVRTQRLEQQLEFYKTRESLLNARRLFAERWDIPEDALKEANNPSDMTEAALDFLKAAVTKKGDEDKRTSKQIEVDRLEASGGHEVSTASGAAPSGSVSSAVASLYEEELKTLREKARRGDQKARIAAFKLEAEAVRKSRAVGRARV